MIVKSGGNVLGTTSVTVRNISPGLFMSSSGHAAALNEDGSANSHSSPAGAGTVIAVFLTGLGPVDHPVAAGAPAPADPLSHVSASIIASIGGKPGPVSFAGLAPGFAGLYQVNLRVPQVPTGDQPLRISVNGVASNVAAISVR